MDIFFETSSREPLTEKMMLDTGTKSEIRTLTDEIVWVKTENMENRDLLILGKANGGVDMGTDSLKHVRHTYSGTIDHCGHGKCVVGPN